MVSPTARRLQLGLDRMLAVDASPSIGARRELDPRLHEYQVRAVNHLQDNPRAALFMEMGLGKTASVLQALTDQHLPAAVIAPKRVAENVWDKEASRWRPDLNVGVAAGSSARRRQVLAGEHDVYVIGIDNLSDLDTSGLKTVVLDELSKFKNHTTKRFKHASRQLFGVPHVWGLTGTPSPNGYQDLWAPMYLIDRGARLGRTITKFRKRYLYPGRQLQSGVVTEWKLRDFAEEEIQRRLSDICLAMRKEDYLQLPQVIRNEVTLTLPPKVMQAYKSMKRDLVATFDTSQVSAANAATATGKLSQISAGFLYPDVDEDPDTARTTDLHDLKYQAVAEICQQASSPVLVFYRFKHELARLIEHLPEARRASDKGVIEQFQVGQVPVMLAHPASMGHGLNLQEHCHTVVWSSLTWSPEDFDQGNSRVDRQGQSHPVIVHMVMADGTVDSQIRDVLAGKATVQDGLLRALT